MIWLYPLFIFLALCQALIMRRLGMVWNIRAFPIYLAPCYASWGIGWVNTILLIAGLIDLRTYLLLFSLFFICFPFIYWGFIPKKKPINGNDLLRRFQETASKIEYLGELLDSTLKWICRWTMTKDSR